MKVAVYYDSLLSKGGAERMVIMLANHLNADIITSGFNPELAKWIPIKGKVLDIGNTTIKVFKPFGVLFEAPLRYLFSKKSLNYDVNIFCGFTSIYAAKKDKINIWRCFTPNRIMYDLKKEKQNDPSILKRIAFKLHNFLFNNLDQNIVKNKFDKIIVQSENVRTRVKKYYNIDPDLIYDPIDKSKFYTKKYDDFYLTVSRLFPEKRVDTIVNAFLKMPTKKLVVVGDGPEKDKLLEKIKKAKNIKLLTDVDEDKLLELYANCLATIYLPKNEDYGLIPLESMAAGKPCIAANEGGCKETVIDNKTGFLIEGDEIQLIKTVRSFSQEKAKKMKTNCIKQAKKFDISNSFKNWDVTINKLI